MHRLLLVFLLLCPCGFIALESPRVCPGMRPLLADRYDKTLFPDYGAVWHYSMPFVEALESYAVPEPCQIIAGNFYIAHTAGMRQEDLNGVLREIRVIQGFLHIHAVDLNITLPKLRTIYAKELTGNNPRENRSAVYVEDFRGHFIRMPELRDVGRGSFGVRHAPNLCGWNATLAPGFHPGQFTRKRAKHFSDRVVVMDEITSGIGEYPASFSSPSCDQRGCPANCSYCFDEETCQQPTKVGCEECGPDAFCYVDGSEVFCCNEGDRCLGSCYDFTEAFSINAAWGYTPVKRGPVAATTCNACAEGSYELWLDPPVGIKCVPCKGEDTKSKKSPKGTARHGPVCMAWTKEASKCQNQSLYVKETNSCHYKCPYGTSQGGGVAATFKGISGRKVTSECLPCNVKYDKATNDLAPACMHECRLFNTLSLFNIRNLYPDNNEFRLMHFNPYSYPVYVRTEDDMRDCHILAGDLAITELTTNSPYAGTRVPLDFLQVLSRVSILKGSLAITDTDLLFVPFLRMLSVIQNSAIILRNSYMVSLDLTRFGNNDICRKSADKDKCSKESRIADNGKWINPTRADNTATGACGSKKCTPEVKGVPMNATNVRYTAGAYVNTLGDCPNTKTFASGQCRIGACSVSGDKWGPKTYSVEVHNHQAYWMCANSTACKNMWLSPSNPYEQCRHCNDECQQDPADPKNNVGCEGGPHRCKFGCKGLRAKFGVKTLCLDGDKCPSHYYLSSGNASAGTVDECKMCDENCITCDGPGSHHGHGGCTKCGIVFLKEVDGKYQETCMHHRRQSCILGDTCPAQDFNPAYELTKDLPDYIGDD